MSASTPVPFSHAGTLATPHGVARLIHLPDGPDPVPEGVLARLPHEEAEHARTLRGFRQVSFVGGRLALRDAMRASGVPESPVLPDARGTPVLPEGWTGSVSHKRTLAAAMVARSAGGTLGIDLEDLSPPRLRVAPRVLRPSELAVLEGLAEDRRWIALLLRFSTKEAIYKALDPHVRRYVGFDEAEVTPGLDGLAEVSLHRKGGEGPFAVQARYRWMPRHILTSVRIRPPR